MVWTVSACFPLMRVSARRSWLCSQEEMRGRTAALPSTGSMQLQGFTVVHAAAPHSDAQGQVLQEEVSTFAAGQDAQEACPQLATAL